MIRRLPRPPWASAMFATRKARNLAADQRDATEPGPASALRRGRRTMVGLRDRRWPAMIVATVFLAPICALAGQPTGEDPIIGAANARAGVATSASAVNAAAAVRQSAGREAAARVSASDAVEMRAAAAPSSFSAARRAGPISDAAGAVATARSEAADVRAAASVSSTIISARRDGPDRIGANDASTARAALRQDAFDRAGPRQTAAPAAALSSRIAAIAADARLSSAAAAPARVANIAPVDSESGARLRAHAANLETPEVYFARSGFTPATNKVRSAASVNEEKAVFLRAQSQRLFARSAAADRSGPMAANGRSLAVPKSPSGRRT